MMLEPIHNQKVLSPKYTQKYLPPIEVDSSQIQKLKESKYNKTLVLPVTQNVIVKHYVETPQGLVLQESDAQSSQTKSNIIDTRPVLSQSAIYRYNLYQDNTINQPVNTKLMNSQSLNNKSVIYRKQFTPYNPANVNPTI